MAVDVAWAGLLVATELPAIGYLTRCLRAPGRNAGKHDAVEQSVDDGIVNVLTPVLGKIVDGVADRRPLPQMTEDGLIPAPPVEDVLASTDLQPACSSLVDALQRATAARAARDTATGFELAEAAALLVAMVTWPIALWQYVFGEPLLNGAALHASNTVLVLAAATTVVLFFLTIQAQNRFDKALVQNRGERGHFG